MGKPEGKVENYFIRKCALRNVFQTKIASPGRRGMPDRIAIGNGKTVFIEMKAPNGRPSAQQLLRIAEINEHGGIAVTAYSKKAIDDIFDKYFT